MKTESHNSSDKKFITILADGKFHQTVPEGTEGAIVRKYEDKEGLEKEKIELVHDSVEGKITGITFEEGDFGKSLHITLDNEGIISAGTTSNFGEDLMKKLPAIDFTKEVKLAPYAFEDEKGKSRKGVTVYQDGEKIDSFYKGEDNKAINGMPEPEGDTSKFDSDDWKMYFMTVRKFLIKETSALSLKHFFEPTSEEDSQTSDEVSLKDF